MALQWGNSHEREVSMYWNVCRHHTGCYCAALFMLPFVVQYYTGTGTTSIRKIHGKLERSQQCTLDRPWLPHSSPSVCSD